jgi:dephospho-CoA kinase
MMTVDILEKRLKSIGKSIFVKYFEQFRNPNYDKGELAKKLLSENPKASSIDAQKTRISNARKIFESKMERKALENIINSDKVESNIIEKAKKILVLIE